MKKLFTLAAAVLASFSLWATALADLNFSEPDKLPEGYVYSATNKPVIATANNKSAVYVTNGGGGSVSAACFTETGFDTSKGKRWMGFITEQESNVVISVFSSKKTFTLYQSDGTDYSTYTCTTNNTWEDWTIENLPAGKYIVSTGNSQCYIASMQFKATCTAPEEELVLNASKKEDVYVGDEITFSTSGGNGAEIVIEGTNEEVLAGNVWTATEGTHTFKATQVKNGDYCAQEDAIVFVVASTTPVEACTIEGAAAAYAGEEVTYTATAANATTYEWYVDGVAANTNSATFVYTSVKGEHIIYATASNKFTAAPVKSNEIALSVTDAPLYDTFIWKKGSGYTGCVEKPNEDAPAQKYSTATFEGMSAMGRASTANTTVTLTIAAKAGYSIESICTYGKLEEPEGAKISWDGENWEDLEAYSETKKEFNAPENTTPVQFIIQFVSVETSSGGLWWRNALVSLRALPDAEITYNSNGGSGTMEPTMNTVAACTFTAPEGKEFDIWNTAADATGKDYSEGDYVYENTTLYAIWRTIGEKSNDASLKALAVEGYTLTPAFASDVYTYSITKAYSAANPAKSAVSATPNSKKAQGYVVDSTENALTVTVTAEDNSTMVYTINIALEDAKKAILRATFSNGVHGYVAGDAINVPYLAGEAEPTFESATFWNADGEPTAEMVEGKLVVTGVDGKAAEYTINYIALTPMEATYDEITFEDVPSYIYSVYGWDSDKGVKFSKDVEEATNHRISEGKDRIYIALPAAKEVKLTAGVSDRPIKVTVNGVVDSSIEKTGDITISLNDTQANLIGIESNGSNGDAGFTKIQLVQEGVDPEPTLYTVTIAETKNGTIVFGDNKADHKYAEGEKVRVVITPDEGYKLVSAKAGEKTLLPDQNGIADFTMPAEDVTVSATFEEESQGIDDINASMKATKRLINGVLFIEKNGKLYNAQGVEIK